MKVPGSGIKVLGSRFSSGSAAAIQEKTAGQIEKKL